LLTLNASSIYWKYIRRRKIENLWWAVRSPKVSNSYKKSRRLEEIFYAELFAQNSVSRVFDIGGNNGDKTDIFLACGARHIVLVEPDPYWSDIHKWRFAKNKKVQICRIAVSSEKGIASLQRFYPGCPLNTLEQKWVETLASDNSRFDKRTIEDAPIIDTVTFKWLAEEYGFPDYAKIDVEGHESRVVAGMEEAPRLLSLEFNLPEFEQELIENIKTLPSKSPNCVMNFVIDYEKGFELVNWVTPVDMLGILSKKDLRYLELFVRAGLRACPDG